MTEAVLTAPSATAVRDEHEQLILAELLGPAGGNEEEVVEGSRPSSRRPAGLRSRPRATRL